MSTGEYDMTERSIDAEFTSSADKIGNESQPSVFDKSTTVINEVHDDTHASRKRSMSKSKAKANSTPPEERLNVDDADYKKGRELVSVVKAKAK